MFCVLSQKFIHNYHTVNKLVTKDSFQLLELDGEGFTFLQYGCTLQIVWQAPL